MTTDMLLEMKGNERKQKKQQSTWKGELRAKPHQAHISDISLETHWGRINWSEVGPGVEKKSVRWEIVRYHSQENGNRIYYLHLIIRT